MFGPRQAVSTTTAKRYVERKAIWVNYSKGDYDFPGQGDKHTFSFPLLRHRLHWLFHNIPVHILIGFFPCAATFRLHDWSSRCLNAVHRYEGAFYPHED